MAMSTLSPTTVLIFANGHLGQPPDLFSRIKKADLIIGADGGANHCLALGIVPDVLLGDLDSVKPGVLEKCKKSGVVLHRYPERKNATDLELSLDLALEKGACRVWLLGAHGGRWDMSLANIMLAASKKYQSMHITLFGEDCTMTILHPGRLHRFDIQVGSTVSFLPLKDDISGITLTGFEYPLGDYTIPYGSTRGISNIVQSTGATEQHGSGILLCVQLIKDGDEGIVR